MKGIVLRWLGGSGGDTLLYTLKKQNKLYTNVYFPSEDLSDKDKTIIEVSTDKEYPTFDNAENYDADPFIIDLKSLSKKTKSFIIKQHFAGEDLDRKMKDVAEILNVGFTLEFLPFVVKANFHKTHTVKKRDHPEKTHLDETLKKINSKLTPAQADSLTIWNLVIDNKNIMEKFKLPESPVMLDNFFHDPASIEKCFKDKGFNLNLGTEYFRNWKNRNSDLLPSAEYQTYLKNQNYNFKDKELDIVERYVFLALSGKKFQFLH